MIEEETATQTCYICYETKDISGQATIRHCSCRGTGGYVHQSCLEVYTTQKAMKFIPHKRLCINGEFLVKFIQGFCYVVEYVNKGIKDSYALTYGMQLWIIVASTSNSISKKKAYLRRLATLQTIISCLRAALYLLEILELHPQELSTRFKDNEHLLVVFGYKLPKSDSSRLFWQTYVRLRR